MKTRNRLAILLLVIGSLQMIGYLTNLRVLRGIGLASGIAPFPKVFCAAHGYEAFAATFFLEGTLANGELWSQPLTPEFYSRLRGPYNRRNVYGAALAFAPRLPQELRDELLRESLAPMSQLRRELGVPADLREIRVRIVPRVGELEGPFLYSANPL